MSRTLFLVPPLEFFSISSFVLPKSNVLVFTLILYFIYFIIIP